MDFSHWPSKIVTKTDTFNSCIYISIIFSLIFIPDPTKVIHTEMMLAPEEFDNYQIGVDTDVTFCLKELRVNANKKTHEGAFPHFMSRSVSRP